MEVGGHIQYMSGCHILLFFFLSRLFSFFVKDASSLSDGSFTISTRTVQKTQFDVGDNRQTHRWRCSICRNSWTLRCGRCLWCTFSSCPFICRSCRKLGSKTDLDVLLLEYCQDVQFSNSRTIWSVGTSTIAFCWGLVLSKNDDILGETLGRWWEYTKQHITTDFQPYRAVGIWNRFSLLWYSLGSANLSRQPPEFAVVKGAVEEEEEANLAATAQCS